MSNAKLKAASQGTPVPDAFDTRVRKALSKSVVKTSGEIAAEIGEPAGRSSSQKVGHALRRLSEAGAAKVGESDEKTSGGNPIKSGWLAA